MGIMIRAAGDVLLETVETLEDTWAGKVRAGTTIRYVDRYYRCARCGRWVRWSREGGRFHPVNADGRPHICGRRSG